MGGCGGKQCWNKDGAFETVTGIAWPLDSPCVLPRVVAVMERLSFGVVPFHQYSTLDANICWEMEMQRMCTDEVQILKSDHL